MIYFLQDSIMCPVLNLMALIPGNRLSSPAKQHTQITLRNSIFGTDCTYLIGCQQPLCAAVCILHSLIIFLHLKLIHIEFISFITIHITGVIFNVYIFECCMLSQKHCFHLMLIHATCTQPFFAFYNFHFHDSTPFSSSCKETYQA